MFKLWNNQVSSLTKKFTSSQYESPMCLSSPQIATSSGGPVQSTRMTSMIHQVASTAQMMTTPQPSPSPHMQMPIRVSGQVQQQQQQRLMPAPSPSPSMMITHSQHGSMSKSVGPMTFLKDTFLSLEVFEPKNSEKGGIVPISPRLSRKPGPVF
jgi:hypothetical protein